MHYAKDFFVKKSSIFLKHSRLASPRYTRLATLLVLVTSLKKRYSIVFSASSPPKTFKKLVQTKLTGKRLQYKVLRRCAPSLQEKDVKNELVHF